MYKGDCYPDGSYFWDGNVNENGEELTCVLPGSNLTILVSGFKLQVELLLTVAVVVTVVLLTVILSFYLMPHLVFAWHDHFGQMMKDFTTAVYPLVVLI